jgi:hypothetical protein
MACTKVHRKNPHPALGGLASEWNEIEFSSASFEYYLRNALKMCI